VRGEVNGDEGVVWCRQPEGTAASSVHLAYSHGGHTHETSPLQLKAQLLPESFKLENSFSTGDYLVFKKLTAEVSDEIYCKFEETNYFSKLVELTSAKNQFFYFPF